MNRIIELSGPGLVLAFELNSDRLRLSGMRREGGTQILYHDRAGNKPGAGPIGNPFLVVFKEAAGARQAGPDAFIVNDLTHDDRFLRAFLQHDELPFQLTLEVSVEGHVATWRGQAMWDGEEHVDVDVYLPMLCRVRMPVDGGGRAIFAKLSGVSYPRLDEINFQQPYIGQMASPVFLIDGGDTGLAVVDNNRCDYLEDSDASVRRSYLAGNKFPLPQRNEWFEDEPAGGEDGPFIGVCYSRLFRPIDANLLGDHVRTAEGAAYLAGMLCNGDCVDVGPVRTYHYQGPWQVGAQWLREQRAWVPMRKSPAAWFEQTTISGEERLDTKLDEGFTFHDLPEVLTEERKIGADFFHIYGFSEPESLGGRDNWTNRGDYLLAAENMGGFDALRRGIDAVHRAGGRAIFYVEGLIVWKRSRIGRSRGGQWTMMAEDGTHELVYPGYWHMCPACPEWQQWFARECAQIVRMTGVDGFFIDSLCATPNHRCFNPAHEHPHPDIWNHGVRQLLRTVREELDKVDPRTIIFVEGAADIAREFADGAFCHSHDWNRSRFDVPLLRFLHPQARVYESFRPFPARNGKPIERSPDDYKPLHLSLFLHGQRYYIGKFNEGMGPIMVRTRRYYDAFPELCDANLSLAPVTCDGGRAQLFDAMPPVLSVINPADAQQVVELKLPVPAGMLVDRVEGLRVPVLEGTARLDMAPLDFRAFEIRR